MHNMPQTVMVPGSNPPVKEVHSGTHWLVCQMLSIVTFCRMAHINGGSPNRAGKQFNTGHWQPGRSYTLKHGELGDGSCATQGLWHALA